MKDHFHRALPSHFNPERFTRIALTSVSKNPKLAECSSASLLGSLMTFAQLGLEPDTPLGHAYLVPFGGEVTPIIGYKGYLDMAYRTGNFEVIDVHEVYECDEFNYTMGLDPTLTHKPGVPPKGKSRGEAILFYAFYKMKNGGRRFRVSTREECLEHGRKTSKSFNSKSMPWQKYQESMCKKTVLHDLLSLAPMSPEDRQTWAIAKQDNAIVTFDADTDKTDVKYQLESASESVEVDIIDEDLL
jgi:recombination protein RecT